MKINTTLVKFLKSSQSQDKSLKSYTEETSKIKGRIYDLYDMASNLRHDGDSAAISSVPQTVVRK